MFTCSARSALAAPCGVLSAVDATTARRYGTGPTRVTSARTTTAGPIPRRRAATGWKGKQEEVNDGQQS